MCFKEKTDPPAKLQKTSHKGTTKGTPALRCPSLLPGKLQRPVSC